MNVLRWIGRSGRAFGFMATKFRRKRAEVNQHRKNRQNPEGGRGETCSSIAGIKLKQEFDWTLPSSFCVSFSQRLGGWTYEKESETFKGAYNGFYDFIGRLEGFPKGCSRVFAVQRQLEFDCPYIFSSTADNVPVDPPEFPAVANQPDRGQVFGVHQGACERCSCRCFVRPFSSSYEHWKKVVVDRF